MPSHSPAVARVPAAFARRARRGALLAAAVAGAALGGGAGDAVAGPTWVSRWSSASAMVAFGDAPPDAEQRGWATLDPADLAASADADLGVDAFAGDYIGGSADATQRATLTDDGLFARLGADLSAGEGNDPRTGHEAIAAARLVLRATFSLDAPTRFTFFPLGTPGDEAAGTIAGYGGSVDGAASLSGEDLSWKLDLTDGRGGLGERREPVEGELPAGTYTLRYELSAEAMAGAVALAVPVELSFDDLDPSDPARATPALAASVDAAPVAPAVVPLPAAGRAGLATAGLVALVALLRRSVVLV